MPMKNTKKLLKQNLESGEMSKILIFLLVAVFVVIIIVYGIIKFTSGNKQKDISNINDNSIVVTPELPSPVYNITLGDIKFSVELNENLGNTLKSQSSYVEDLVTTEKFIKVVIGAQNKGKNNVPQYSWEVGNIVDSEGRNFVSINDKAYSYVPKPDLCGAILKPEFQPVPCVKYYEVSKASKNLKIVVKITEPKKEALLDLKAN